MATIKDIAARSGLSPATVIRALSGKIMGKRKDARERSERAWKAARELGYHPSNLARALREGKTHTIGLVVGSITNRYFASLAETVLDETEKCGYRMILELTRWDMDRCNSCLDYFRRIRTDGIFYAAGRHSLQDSPLLGQFQQENFPMMMLYPNDYGVSYVMGDHAESFRQALHCFSTQQAKDVTFAYWERHSPQDQLLIRQFKENCLEHSMQPHLMELKGLDDVVSLAKRAPEFLICNAPYCLKHFFDIISQNTTYHPSVIGFYDEWNWLEHPDPLQGTIMIQSERQIRLAVRELIAQIEEKNDPVAIGLQSTFFNRNQFADIPVKDLSSTHLFPF